MNKYAPLARIILRYIAGLGAGASVVAGEHAPIDPEMVMIVSGVIALVVEVFYYMAKKKGLSI